MENLMVAKVGKKVCAIRKFEGPDAIYTYCGVIAHLPKDGVFWDATDCDECKTARLLKLKKN